MLPVIGARAQRLRPAPPLSKAPPMGLIGADGLAFHRSLVEDSRTSRDLVGVPAERESYRKIPKQRMSMVLRPGYRERGQAAVSRAEEQGRLEEQVHAAVRQARTEHTRNRYRAVAESNRAISLDLPVQRRAAYEAAMAQRAQELEVAYEWARQGMEDVATLPGLPPATPGPPAKAATKAATVAAAYAPTDTSIDIDGRGRRSKGKSKSASKGAQPSRTRTLKLEDDAHHDEKAIDAAPQPDAAVEARYLPRLEFTATAHRVEFVLGGSQRPAEGGTLPPLASGVLLAAGDRERAPPGANPSGQRQRASLS